MRAYDWTCRFSPVGRSARQIRWVIILRAHVESRKARKVADATLPRKSSKESYWVPVPQTDTGRRGENPQARVRTLV